MLKVIKNIHVLSPEDLGIKDVLIAGNKIIAIQDKIDIEGVPIEIFDGSTKTLLPGLVDSHVHICGGGGEGGYKTRTPRLTLSQMIKAGVTTVVGLVGTDSVSRSIEDLIATAKGLKQEGVSVYCLTGSYSLPLKTLTGDIQKDLLMVEEIIGVGEIAINDHRSSHSGLGLFKMTASESRVGGILSGKCGIVNIHLGDGKDDFKDIYQCLEETEIPIKQFYPTHVNRNHRLFDEAITYCKKGGYVDFTASLNDDIDSGVRVKPADAVVKMLQAGVSISQMTLSSDGQGSLPNFDNEGNLIGLKVGSVSSLFHIVKELINNHQLPLAEAIKLVTINPSTVMKLENKGQIAIGKDADLIIYDSESQTIESVFANGQCFMHEGEILIKGTFE